MSASFLVLLPPSETKRDGGNAAFGGRLTGTVEAPRAPLSWPQLEPVREGIVADLERLAANAADTARALRLGAALAEAEAQRNRAVRSSPRLPAAERYTGVLYDALDVATLGADARAWLDAHVAVHSALYGLVGAGEAIAAYRCSATSRLPGESLRRRWAQPIDAALAAHDGTVLDLRSSAYAALGGAGARTIGVDVVTDDGAGGTRALGHFNKRAKGELVRALATTPAARALRGDADVHEISRVLRAAGLDACASDAGRLRLSAVHPAAR